MTAIWRNPYRNVLRRGRIPTEALACEGDAHLAPRRMPAKDRSDGTFQFRLKVPSVQGPPDCLLLRGRRTAWNEHRQVKFQIALAAGRERRKPIRCIQSVPWPVRRLDTTEDESSKRWKAAPRRRPARVHSRKRT